MSSTIVNMTALIVARNITDILADAPKYPYKIAFSIPYYQHKLLVYILNRTRNYYVVQQGDIPTQTLETLRYFIKEQPTIESLIRESLAKVLEEEPDWTKYVEMPDDCPAFYGVDRLA